MPFILSGPFQGPLIDVATFPTPHEAYGLCAAGLPQFKAAGLAVVFDLTAHTFYRVSPKLPQFKAAGLAVVFDLTAHTFYRVSLVQVIRPARLT